MLPNVLLLFLAKGIKSPLMVIELLTLKSRKTSNLVKELSMAFNLVFTLANELSILTNLVFTLVVVPLIFNIKFPLTLIFATLKSCI